MMKRLFAIFFAWYFLLGGLMPRMDFSQLLFVAEAVEHFYCHQHESTTQGHRFTLADFLSMHFFSEETHEHEANHAHDDLPFQQFSHTFQIAIAEVIAHSAPVGLMESPAAIGHLVSLYSYDYCQGIDHPPSAA